jgi:hypothetical protein
MKRFAMLSLCGLLAMGCPSRPEPEEMTTDTIAITDTVIEQAASTNPEDYATSKYDCVAGTVIRDKLERSLDGEIVSYVIIAKGVEGTYSLSVYASNKSIEPLAEMIEPGTPIKFALASFYSGNGGYLKSARGYNYFSTDRIGHVPSEGIVLQQETPAKPAEGELPVCN